MKIETPVRHTSRNVEQAAEYMRVDRSGLEMCIWMSSTCMRLNEIPQEKL